MADEQEPQHRDEPLDQKVSIFVGSRYASGQPIPPETRQHQVRCVSGFFSRKFEGASAEDIEARVMPITGTFRHEANRHGGIVDEAVLRVWTAVGRSTIAKTENLEAVLDEARRVRQALGQESVLVEWGREVRFTERVAQGRQHHDFAALPRWYQEDFALTTWYRVIEPSDLYGVFSLAGWMVPEPPQREGGRLAIARSADSSRTLWEWPSDDDPDETNLLELGPDDLLVKRASDSRLRFWLRTTDGWAGPREIPLATYERPIGRLAIEFVISALQGTARFQLADLLNAEGATARFYTDIRTLVQAITRAVPRDLRHRATGIAQRLVGRLLFVRFVEEKGWLPHNGLRQAWYQKEGAYYPSILVPLFEALNRPVASRKDETKSVPYLNGGLFDAREEDVDLDLPDTIFDPDSKSRTLLRLLYDYDFTLDERAGRDQLVSIDPAMLGRVLEGLTEEAARKNKGVHYTPEPIARALALGGLLPQLARRMKDAGHDLDEEGLRLLLIGRGQPLTTRTAEALSAQLHTLRIVDPAVGSGALLVACLEVLLELEAVCQRSLGSDLRRGSYVWASAARRFVTECLYGVDISADAIDVARLRLWLYLAVGEAEPTALPDLGYNLRVGNSLGYDEAELRLEKALEQKDVGARRLEYDAVDEHLNRALDARRQFLKSATAEPSERRKAFDNLEATERALRGALHGRTGRRDEAPPFAWAVHFPEVFAGPNRGFDLVIANPPYVRSSRLSESDNESYRKNYRSMRGNADLYYAFVERCFRAPAPIEEEADRRGLAGRAGHVAFILPRFVETKSAAALRSLLAERGHVERWVDFVHNQVFQTSDTYVGLLFARADTRGRSTFNVQIVPADAFAQMHANQPWLEPLPTSRVAYGDDGEIWKVRGADGVERRRLAELATVQVGIQTSLDDFFLCSVSREGSSSSTVLVRSAFEEVELEKDVLLACAKGSSHLHEARFSGDCWVIWPYDSCGELMSAEKLAERFPKAWQYFFRHKAALEAREGGKFAGDRWWRFRRPQGITSARQPKILVPSIMLKPTAFFDREGKVVCTASGKGGGGGWAIQPLPGTQLSLEGLAEYMRSQEFGEWLTANGEPKKGGWWGVDRETLKSCPVPESAWR